MTKYTTPPFDTINAVDTESTRTNVDLIGIAGIGATSFGMRTPLCSTTFGNIGRALNYGYSGDLQIGGGTQDSNNPQIRHNVGRLAYEYGYPQVNLNFLPAIPAIRTGHIASAAHPQNAYSMNF